MSGSEYGAYVLIGCTGHRYVTVVAVQYLAVSDDNAALAAVLPFVQDRNDLSIESVKVWDVASDSLVCEVRL